VSISYLDSRFRLTYRIFIGGGISLHLFPKFESRTPRDRAELITVLVGSQISS
jgi:hypothetical protein